MSRHVPKPWGWELIWAETDRYVGKILHIEAGHALSLQYHERKDETIYVLSGRILFEHGAAGAPALERVTLERGDSFHITPHLRHRMTAEATSDVLEASTPELDDVVRLDDRYGRVR